MDSKKYLDYEGLKHLWSKINSKTDSLIYEIIYISLSSNQDMLVSGEISVTVDGKVTKYNYTGSQIELKVKSGSRYKITLPEFERHTKPSDVEEFTAVGGGSRTLNYEYKACRLTFSMNIKSGSASLVCGNVKETVSDTSSILVPYNTNTLITPNDVEGYITPDPINAVYTSNKEISLRWEEIRLGVFIRHINGSLYAPEDWLAGEEDVDCIAIYGEEFAMGISKTYLMNPSNSNYSSPLNLEWEMNSAGADVTMSGVETIEDSWSYVGEQNTKKWVQNMASYGGEPAFQAALNYTFPSGKKGYVMGIKEAQLLATNLNAVTLP